MSARYQVVYKKMLKQTPTLDDLASFSPSLCDPQRASHIRFFAALLGAWLYTLTQTFRVLGMAASEGSWRF